MVTKKITINFDRCKNTSSLSVCKSEQEINHFISDMSIYTYSLSKGIEFNEHNKSPTFLYQQLVSIFSPAIENNMKSINFYLRLNSY